MINDNNNNNLDDNNDDLNKTLNETDDSIVPFDSNVIFVGLLLVSVYFYFTFFGIVCRNFRRNINWNKKYRYTFFIKFGSFN